MATHSSVLAWRIPGTGEPGGLASMGSHRVGLSRSGGEKGLRGSGAGTLGVPLGGTRRVGGLLARVSRRPPTKTKARVNNAVCDALFSLQSIYPSASICNVFIPSF